MRYRVRGNAFSLLRTEDMGELNGIMLYTNGLSQCVSGILETHGKVLTVPSILSSNRILSSPHFPQLMPRRPVYY